MTHKCLDGGRRDRLSLRWSLTPQLSLGEDLGLQEKFLTPPFAQIKETAN